MRSAVWSAVFVVGVLSSCAHAPMDGPETLSKEAASIDPQHLVYLNSRLALAEGKPKDALKLWLLRNALKSKGLTPTDDPDFRSVVWASLGETGYCQDGLLRDESGAGLWPLALHNWLLKPSSKQPPRKQPAPFRSFQSGAQQRFISLHDVLSKEEMQSVRFFRGRCWYPYIETLRFGNIHWIDLKDRLSSGILMRDALVRAQSTLSKKTVRTQVLLETRLFDLDLALSKIAARRAKRESGLSTRVLRSLGISAEGAQLLREQRLQVFRQSEYNKFLGRSLSWSEEEWLSLSKARRLSLFDEAQQYAGTDDARVEATIELMTDAMIEQKRGAELQQWLGFAHSKDPAISERWALEKGERLMALEKESGFSERGPVALQRGVAFLRQGAQSDALRSFAFALSVADESRRAEEVHNLAKRWLAYVLSQFETDEESLAILDVFVSKVDRDELLEMLLWRAAFHVDEASFERIASRSKTKSRLARKIALLRPLAKGDAGALWQGVVTENKESPYGVLAFARKLSAELSLEPLDVRSNNRNTLRIAQTILEETRQVSSRGIQKKIDELLIDLQVMLDAVNEFDESAEGRARAQGPGYEAYAGSVRLAPSDPLPWPFPKPKVTPPSPFRPIKLTPVEYRVEGKTLLGWKIHE